MRSDITASLLTILPAERVRTRYIDLVSYGADAGFYFLLPRAVVRPRTEQEILSLFTYSHEHSIPLVFRTGGTSLAGQAVTDGILVDLSQYWNALNIEQQGEIVRVQPGITGAMVNAYLKKYKRKIGPDPSSISAAMMGGILSNNSSGMCCGVLANAYHTTRHIRFILPDGNTFSTENDNDYERFGRECPGISEELTAIRNEIAKDPMLYARIRKKYQTKNTVGYSLNAFIDHEHPLDILSHLLIGAEGTLAFIAEAVMNTVPDFQYKSTTLLYFPDIHAACNAILPLRNAGAEAVELMDRASLRSIELFPGMPAVVKTLGPLVAALLVEFQDNNPDSLQQKVNAFMVTASALSILFDPAFTTDENEQAFLWKVRKGLFPAVGAVRASGTTVILEDIAFPVEQLGNAITDLQQLFLKHEYTHAIIFGHAKDGNIHFVVTQSFNTEKEIARYDRFLKDVVDMVVHKYDGTLKAEHGTGRNMAPFVETEWGAAAYAIMKRLKKCIDPHHLLNPGVIINEDKKAHIKHLKALPAVEEEVDKCIECGYCEHKCPSRDITLTPRRRIIVRRQLKNLEAAGDRVKHKLLLNQYQYDGLDTCAVDGLCATACPVDINTGDLVKRLRRENHSRLANRTALFVAKHFLLTENLARAALFTGTLINSLFGRNAMTRLTAGIRKLLPGFPLWSPQLRSAPAIPRWKNAVQAISEQHTVVYFPSCISRVMGRGMEGKKNIMETFISVARKAGIEVIIPQDCKGNCCGQIFSSKGFQQAHGYTANQVIEKLWLNTLEGKLAVITDVSSCAHSFHLLRPVLNEENRQRFDRMKIMDSVDFLHDIILAAAPAVAKKEHVVLHPVCALQKMGIHQKFEVIARQFATHITIPVHAGCCGMAGDRGFLFPELTASATSAEVDEIAGKDFEGYYSSTKTCEMALSDAAGKSYESILYLADETMLPTAGGPASVL